MSILWCDFRQQGFEVLDRDHLGDEATLLDPELNKRSLSEPRILAQTRGMRRPRLLPHLHTVARTVDFRESAVRHQEVMSELVPLGRRDVAHLSEDALELAAVATSRALTEVLSRQERSHLLGERCGDELVDRDVLALRKLAHALMEGFGQAKADAAHEARPMRSRN